MRQLSLTKRSLKSAQLSVKFKDRIVGQPAATDALIEILEKYQSGFYDKTKPIGSLLFLGATGTGKTATVEAFVEGLFGNPTNFLKVDCAEFQHSHEIAKLVGSPPGYLGHRETHPFFTNQAIKACQVGHLPFTVILFDEIEKASDALWNLLLGVLDKGSLTTGTNEKVDMTSTVIIMTSNVGSSELAAKEGEGSLGFSTLHSTPSVGEMKDIAMGAARKKFMPEFINRLDKVVMFETLTEKDIAEIMQLELKKLRERVILDCANIFDFEITPAAYAQILKEGYDRRYNARNLKRAIEQHVGRPMARLVATCQIMNNDLLIVDYKDGEWEYHAEGKIIGGNAAKAVSA